MTRPHDALPAALVLLVLTGCELPDKVCIGDCPEPIGSSSSADDDGASDSAGTTTTVSDSGGPVDVCDVVDDLATGPGCNDGTQQAGEFCFGFSGLGAGYPQDLNSFVAGPFDPGGADVLMSFADGTIRAWLDGPSPHFDSSSVSWPAPYVEDSLLFTGVGDLDEDGDLDAVGRRIGGDADIVEILLLAQGAHLVDATSVSLGPIVFGPEVLDWDQDGHLDLVVVTTMAANLENAIVLRGDGDGAFTVAPQFGFAPSETLLAVGSLGPDGAPNDFAAVGEDGAIVTIPPAGAPVQLGASAVVHDLAITELDGDGRGDIVALYEDTSTGGTMLAILLQSGAPEAEDQFTVTRYPVHCGSRTFALGDLDQDGALDIVAGGADDGTLTVRRGDGQGGFSQAMSLWGGAARHIEIADFNGDGSIDIAASGVSSMEYVVNTP